MRSQSPTLPRTCPRSGPGSIPASPSRQGCGSATWPRDHMPSGLSVGGQGPALRASGQQLGCVRKTGDCFLQAGARHERNSCRCWSDPHPPRGTHTAALCPDTRKPRVQNAGWMGRSEAGGGTGPGRPDQTVLVHSEFFALPRPTRICPIHVSIPFCLTADTLKAAWDSIWP